MNQPRGPLEDAAQSAQVVNAPEATACKTDVPLLVPVKHLLRGETQTQSCIFRLGTVQQVQLVSLQCFINRLYLICCTVLRLGTVQCCTTYSRQTPHSKIESRLRLLLTRCRSYARVFPTAKLTLNLCNEAKSHKSSTADDLVAHHQIRSVQTRRRFIKAKLSCVHV